MFRNSIFLLFVSLFIGVSCSDTGDSVGSRTVVILTPDEVGEIVLPPGAFDNEVLVTLPPTTTNMLTEVVEEKVEETVEELKEVSTDAPESLEELPSTIASGKAAAVSTTSTTSTTTTTTTEPPKVTIPIAEEEENAGVKLMDTLDDFNSCLSSEGYEFIGLPNQEGGPEDPANNPDYLQALVLCNSRTNIASTFQEFQESRNEMTPDEIKEQNEQTIALGECLNRKGWDVGDLSPDQNGLLNPSQFQSPDGSINTDDIRSCASELSLDGD
tara:strand:+ start:63 stop:875 length:813 start_codon:yes stop_codon:yes gene_type:complete